MRRLSVEAFEKDMGYVSEWVRQYEGELVFNNTLLSKPEIGPIHDDWTEEFEIELADDVENGKAVIHCPTELEAKCVLNELHKLGYKWVEGQYLTEWDKYTSDTCYKVVPFGIKFRNINYTYGSSTCNIDNFYIERVSEPEETEQETKLKLARECYEHYDILEKYEKLTDTCANDIGFNQNCNEFESCLDCWKDVLEQSQKVVVDELDKKVERGDIFDLDGEYYIVAGVDYINKLNERLDLRLVSLSDGNRWFEKCITDWTVNEVIDDIDKVHPDMPIEFLGQNALKIIKKD